MDRKSYLTCQILVLLYSYISPKEANPMPKNPSQTPTKTQTKPCPQLNKETLEAMLEAKKIAKDPSVKGYHDVNQLFEDLLK